MLRQNIEVSPPVTFFAEIPGLRKNVEGAHIFYGISMLSGASSVGGKSELEHVQAVADFLNLSSLGPRQASAKPKVAEIGIIDILQYRNPEMFIVPRLEEKKQAQPSRAKYIDPVNNPVILTDKEIQAAFLSLTSVIPIEKTTFDFVDLANLYALMVKNAAKKVGDNYEALVGNAWKERISGVTLAVSRWSDVYTYNQYLEIDVTHERQQFNQELQALLKRLDTDAVFKAALDELVQTRALQKAEHAERARAHLAEVANQDFLLSIQHNGVKCFIKALLEANPVDVSKAQNRLYFFEELAHMKTKPENTRFVYSKKIPSLFRKILKLLSINLYEVDFRNCVLSKKDPVGIASPVASNNASKKLSVVMSAPDQKSFSRSVSHVDNESNEEGSAVFSDQSTCTANSVTPLNGSFLRATSAPSADNFTLSLPKDFVEKKQGAAQSQSSIGLFAVKGNGSKSSLYPASPLLDKDPPAFSPDRHIVLQTEQVDILMGMLRAGRYSTDIMLIQLQVLRKMIEGKAEPTISGSQNSRLGTR
jgi:ABC-type uncharacterized transport system substrate-binding protein